MADTVTSQTIFDGAGYAVLKFTNTSDGTGEAAVLKVDVSALAGSPSAVSIQKVHYSVNGMVATLLWDATSDVRILDLAGDGMFDFTGFGGLPNNGGAGVTGNILLTTTGASVGDSYSLIVEVKK